MSGAIPVLFPRSPRTGTGWKREAATGIFSYSGDDDDDDDDDDDGDNNNNNNTS